ncbi:hypothetical protein A33M_4323 [Rhodovulum sp. PH10]|uniref:caspase family protein n=1 Tax=Rhodovulum sp. PH10 TaxID=1187851 RepID=UPI00027C2D31|nr:caspase family protein [Rhodovulum sp. PH10]EJW10636.1 hypothetical protein A33M_4323 [Rhodovulum sp. PH10]
MKQSALVVAALLLLSVLFNGPSRAEAPALRLAQAAGKNRIALVIGNATYPDDNRPLAHPIKDAEAIAAELKRAGFEVSVGTDLTKQKLRTALDTFKAKISPGTAALLFFSGYGIQTGKQSYIIPVDAQIWTEGEVKRDGISVESILAEMNAAGAGVKVVIVDAARRNPFERRFRGFSAGLAALNIPAGTLAMYSAAADKVASNAGGEHSLFVDELLKELRSPDLSAEAILNNTRMGVSRASKNEQVPWVASSLIEEFYFSRGAREPVTQAPAAQEPEKQAAAPPPPPPPPPPVPTVTETPAAPASPPAPKPAETAAAPAPPPPPAADDEPEETPKKPEPSPAIASTAPAPQQPAAPKPAAPKPVAPKPPVAAPPPPPPEAESDASPPVERDAAILALDAQIAKNPSDGNIYYRRGQAWAERGRFGLAAEDFGRAIRLDPRDAEAYNNRCFTRAVLDQLDDAVADCDEALRLRPDYVDALDSRGLAHLKLGRYDAAIADYDKAIGLNPRLATAYYGRGKAKLQKGDKRGGNADIRNARAIAPTVPSEFASYGVK